MRRVLVGVVVLVAILGLALPPSASAQANPSKSRALVQSTEQAKDQAVEAQKLAVAQQIIRARELARRRGAFVAPTVRYWPQRLTQLSLSQLLEISAAGPDANLNEMVTARGGQILSDNVSPDLGDTSADLVYTKVNPCRVADTRVAGGPLANASQRNFQISGSNPALFTPQGGVPCGIPYPGATAVAVNITVTGAAGYGWLRAWPYGSSGTASIINYTPGQTIANGLILPVCDEATDSCGYDVTIRADAAGTHVLIDVMGYFQKVDTGNFLAVVATDRESGTTTLPIGTCTNYHSISITVPGPGKIVVEGSVNIELNHTAGIESEVDWGIGTSLTGCSFHWGLDGSYVYVPNTAPSGRYMEWATARYVHTANAAGTYTFYSNGERSLSSTGLGDFNMYWGGLTATFHPQ